MRTQVAPLLVGLSLLGASATLLYIWYKTKDNDEEESRKTGDGVDGGTGSGIIANQSPASGKKKSKLECVIPNSIVPLILGRSSANIKSIEEKTDTIIRFRKKDDNNQICEITGDSQAVQKAADLIKQQASPPPIITEEIIIPKSACGKIIGRCGESLQEICRKSMAKVYVDSGDRSTGNDLDGNQTRRVLITGTSANIRIARTLIEEKVKQDAELRKSVEEIEQKREPRGGGGGGGGNKHFSDASSTHSSSSSASSIESPSGSINGTTIKTTKSIERLPTTKSTSSNNSDELNQLEVYVSAIASPSRFWLQLVGPQSKKLDKLVESMTEYYNIDENRKFHKIADPYLGQIVTAMFKYDGKWYRAEIVGILPNEFNPRNVVLDLYFVDFGDSEYVAPHEVYELRTDFLTLRFQAIECFLANVKPAHTTEIDVWHPEGISRFEELTHVAKWQKINARIVTTKERKYGDPVRREGSPVPGVELIDSSDNVGKEINVANELINEGFAVTNITEPIRPGQIVRLDNNENGDGDKKSNKIIKKSSPPPPPNGQIKITNGNHLNSDDEIDKNMINNGKKQQSPTSVATNGSNGSSISSNNGSSNVNDDANTFSKPQQQPPPQSHATSSSIDSVAVNSNNNNDKHDKLSAIRENTTNENYENILTDSVRQNDKENIITSTNNASNNVINSFLASEQNEKLNLNKKNINDVKLATQEMLKRT